MIDVVECCVCRSRNFRPRFKIQGYAIIACQDCGCCYSTPRQTDSIGLYTSDKYYSDERFYVDYLSCEPAYRVGFRTKLRMIRRLCPDVSSLLDVGCAFGAFMDEAAKIGFRSAGIELCRTAAERAAKVGEVHCGDFLAYRSDRQFDIVTFIDSLEHFPDPRAALLRAHALITHGGAVAIMVPNIGSWFSRLMGRRWHLLLPEEHLTYFTRGSLRRLLSDVGFDVVHLGTGGYGRSLAEIASVILRGRGISRRLLESPLRRILIEVNLGDLFVIARKKNE